ncbi:hypothetical protein OESDEN_01508 [Oesophagostomum dentatum]|uniref:Uncharacterized protein n=1 Tax=Oesophagostomum dentatum TaxID=61180 RepID=A0A0B1TMM2_OESDE|nr:hypothetical protein OESDEN_01508 [Oesophagostomum dentatum]
MAIVFIEPLQCQKDGPQVALLPPQFRYKPNDDLGPSVTDEEIGKATCFAFGWGVTESLLSSLHREKKSQGGNFTTVYSKNERSPEWPHIIYLNIRREWNGKLTGLWTSSFTKTLKLEESPDQSIRMYVQYSKENIDTYLSRLGIESRRVIRQ